MKPPLIVPAVLLSGLALTLILAGWWAAPRETKTDRLRDDTVVIWGDTVAADDYVGRMKCASLTAAIARSGSTAYAGSHWEPRLDPGGDPHSEASWVCTLVQDTPPDIDPGTIPNDIIHREPMPAGGVHFDVPE